MDWTSEKPTEPGWYWLRWEDGRNEPPTIARVLIGYPPGRLSVMLVGDEDELYLDRMDDHARWLHVQEPQL